MEANAALVKKGSLDEGCDLDNTYMQIRKCPSCGLVAMYTSTCGYCGSKCD